MESSIKKSPSTFACAGISSPILSLIRKPHCFQCFHILGCPFRPISLWQDTVISLDDSTDIFSEKVISLAAHSSCHLFGKTSQFMSSVGSQFASHSASYLVQLSSLVPTQSRRLFAVHTLSSPSKIRYMSPAAFYAKQLSPQLATWLVVSSADDWHSSSQLTRGRSSPKQLSTWPPCVFIVSLDGHWRMFWASKVSKLHPYIFLSLHWLDLTARCSRSLSVAMTSHNSLTRSTVQSWAVPGLRWPTALRVPFRPWAMVKTRSSPVHRRSSPSLHTLWQSKLSKWVETWKISHVIWDHVFAGGSRKFWADRIPSLEP